MMRPASIITESRKVTLPIPISTRSQLLWKVDFSRMELSTVILVIFFNSSAGRARRTWSASSLMAGASVKKPEPGLRESVMSPSPTRISSPGPPLTTEVGSRSCGPFASRAAAVVYTFVEEAGTRCLPSLLANSTSPVSRSVISADRRPSCRSFAAFFTSVRSTGVAGGLASTITGSSGRGSAAGATS